MFIRDFLLQTQTESQKTKDLYPKRHLDLDVKVSFGQGNLSYVPWMSFLGQGMTTSNGYYPVFLFYKKINTLILAYGLSETINFPNPWSEKIITEKILIKNTIENPERYGDSYVFKRYKINFSDNDLKIYSNDKEIYEDNLLHDLESIINEYKQCLDISISDQTSDISKGLFYMEKQLEEFIIDNWDETDFGKKYYLIDNSQQYHTPIGIIDILAKDKVTDEYVVIELKRNQTSDDTVGQLMRYMGWVKEHLDSPGVKGIIVCGRYDKKLDYARKMFKDDVEVYLYQVNFSLDEYKN